MQINYRTIDTHKDRDIILNFNKLTLLSSGMAESLDEEKYISQISKKVSENPEGYVFLELEDEIIGQMELQRKIFENQLVGYISKYFLTERYRGKGVSKKLVEYTENLFKRWDLKTYHLRVAKTNIRAVNFYKKSGLTIMKEEENSYGISCFRMQKKL